MDQQQPSTKHNNAPPAAPFDAVVERNIRALLQRQKADAEKKPFEDRVADAITGFTGSMKFVYVHLTLYGVWALCSTGWLRFLPRFDPTFVGLATIASVEAIFLSTFVLISQNRDSAEANKRAELDLQVNLLTEHELTRLIQLVTTMAERMGIDTQDTDLKAASHDVQPEQVIEQIETNQRRFAE